MEVKFICCGIFIFTIILAMILAVTIPLMLVKESFTFKYVGENTFNKRRHRLCWQLYESLYKIDSKLTLNKLEGFADKSLANSTDEKFFEFVLYKYFESRSYRSLLLWQHSLEKPLFSWAKIGYWYIPIYIAVFAFIAQGNMKNEIMIGTFTFLDCKEILEALSPILLFFFWQIEQK